MGALTGYGGVPAAQANGVRAILSSSVWASAQKAFICETTSKKSALCFWVIALKLLSVWFLSLFYFSISELAPPLEAGLSNISSMFASDISKMGYASVGFHGGCFLNRFLLAQGSDECWSCIVGCVWDFNFCFGCKLFLHAVNTHLSEGESNCHRSSVPSIIAASVAICLLGFFFAPSFATISRPSTHDQF